MRNICLICKKKKPGITSPWGITRVCADAACQLVAQAQDKGIKAATGTTVMRPEKPLQITRFPQYAGVGIAYLGDGRWALGFMDNNDPQKRTWYRDIPETEVMRLFAENAKFCVRQEEHAIFGR